MYTFLRPLSGGGRAATGAAYLQPRGVGHASSAKRVCRISDFARPDCPDNGTATAF